MTIEEIYLDLSKLSEEKQSEIFSLLPESYDLNYRIVYDYTFLHFMESEWFVDFNSYQVTKKIEINYEQFKTLINE